MVHSKNKGYGFEREVCKFLSNLYSESFIRVKDSGAFIGGKNISRTQTLTENQIRSSKGDICPPDSWVNFNCECKSYADFPFHKLFDNQPIPLLEKWISQLMSVADENDVNLLFMKFNRKGRYILFENKFDFSVEKYITYDKWKFANFDDFFAHNSLKLKNICSNI